VDKENGRWSHGAVSEDDDIPAQWHQAEPAPYFEDREVWARCLMYLRESPTAAVESLLVVAKSRAHAKLREALKGRIGTATYRGQHALRRTDIWPPRAHPETTLEFCS
jgi:hypothetical protein